VLWDILGPAEQSGRLKYRGDTGIKKGNLLRILYVSWAGFLRMGFTRPQAELRLTSVA
jgi:hypothetical protein